MPKYYYKNDGDEENVHEVEISIEPSKLKDTFDTLTKEKAELEERVKKYENKDMNFAKFRESTEEEKKNMMSKFSEEKRDIYNNLSELKDKLSDIEKQDKEGTKNQVLNSLALGDEELKKQLDESYQKSLMFGGEPKTKEEVITRMQEAYRYLKGTTPPVNPLNSYVPNTAVFEAKSTDFTQTEKGKAVLHEIDPILYPNK
ncbi:MAG: hypothetical protein WC332_02795 [Clostridia bacterium]|jgi:predicted transcriptional regulator